MALTFENLIAHNRRYSTLLVTLMVIGTTFLVACFYTLLTLNREGLVTVEDWTRGAIIGAAIGLIGAILSFYRGNSLVLYINDAVPIEKYHDPILFNVVEEMAIAAGIPAPAIYAIKDESPNAFATGRDSRHAAIAITSGLRKKLSREELQGVVAHEIAHIKNNDIRLMMLVGVFAGIIVLLSDFFIRRFLDVWKMKAFRSGKPAKSASNVKFRLLIGVLSFFGALLLSWIAPLIAKLLQLAVSREREYLADATAVQLSRNPLALASALQKIATDPVAFAADNRATEHMFIINPCPKRRLKNSDGNSIWSTHPPTILRIKRLRELAGDHHFMQRVQEAQVSA